jgi:hypothetical protein
MRTWRNYGARFSGERGVVMVWLIVAIVVISVVVVLLAIGWFTFVLLSEVSERFDDSEND